MASENPRNWSGSVKSFNKPDLIALANDLGLSGVGTKADLTKRIQPHLKAQEETLVADPRFQGLYVYRSNPGTNGTVKTSVDKQLEDRIQAKKDAGGRASTNAQKVLVERDYTVDPQASFTVLNGSKTVDPELSSLSALDDDGDGDKSSEPADDQPLATPNVASALEEGIQVESRHVPNAIVLVKFRHTLDSEAPRETYAEGVKVFAEQRAGRTVYTIRLSHLFRCLGQSEKSQETPLKGPKQRVYRSGFSDASSRYRLGYMSDFLSAGDQTPAPLKKELFDRYPVTQLDDGLFVCELYWDVDQESVTENVAVKGADETSRNVAASTESEMDVDGDDEVPIDKARVKRDKRKAEERDALLHEKDQGEPWAGFYDFIRSTCDIAKEELVVGKVDYIKDVLPRYTLENKLLEGLKATNWKGSSGGYIIPESSKYFPKTKFTQDQAMGAIGVKHSTFANDQKLFSSLGKASRAKDWIKDPSNEDSELFATLTVAQFKFLIKFWNDNASKVDTAKYIKVIQAFELHDELPSAKDLKDLKRKRGSSSKKKAKKDKRDVDSSGLDDSGSE
ncbi:hypothetical protein BKA70DRAFT_1216456 [Coprinopsis sp. MPI-PUGE-AT-0042]|nr:hypothetical protein BKA70DRAFT_1216456 [Coprinopsis sp. MPI-PUGE-AT-0042]